MGPSTVGDKFRMSAWTLLVRAGFVAAVLLIALLPGFSVAGSLIAVSAAISAWTLVAIWFPADRRRRASGPPGAMSGDREPRRPLPSAPSTAVSRSRFRTG